MGCILDQLALSHTPFILLLCISLLVFFLFCFLVALYVKSGGCTLEEKALVASTLMDPPNTVGYIIVDDIHRKQKRKKKKTSQKNNNSSSQWFLQLFYQQEQDDEWVEETMDSKTDEDLAIWDEKNSLVQTLKPLEEIMPMDDESSTGGGGGGGAADSTMMEELVNDDESVPVSSLPKQDNAVLSYTDDGASDDETVPLSPKEISTVWNTNQNTQSGSQRALINIDSDKSKKEIQVAILHVTSTVGVELLKLLVKENANKVQNGGYKVMLNSKGEMSARTVMLWTLLAIIVCATGGLCLCLVAGYLDEEEAARPQPPVRRRLTHAQVRAKFPAFVYNPEDHVEQPLDEECAICLDDFEENTRLRRLPCGHVFHATCIARWLIERSAVCPLCKYDLYEDEEEISEPQQATTVSARSPTATEASLWTRATRRWFSIRMPSGGVDTTPLNVSAASPTGGAAGTRSSTEYISLWHLSQMLTPSRSAEGNQHEQANNTVPTPPPARAFQWPSVLSTASTTTAGAVAPETTTSDEDGGGSRVRRSWGALFGGRPGRRQRASIMEGGMMQTELTEPLMTAADRVVESESTAAATTTTTALPEPESVAVTNDLSHPEGEPQETA